MLRVKTVCRQSLLGDVGTDESVPSYLLNVKVLIICSWQVPFFVDLDGKVAVVATPPPGAPAASALAAAISAALGSPVPLPLQSLLAADAAQLPAIAAELAPGSLSEGQHPLILCRTLMH